MIGRISGCISPIRVTKQGLYAGRLLWKGLPVVLVVRLLSVIVEAVATGCRCAKIVSEMVKSN